jgi:hypothetical protein
VWAAALFVWKALRIYSQLLQEFRQLELNFTKDSAISEPKDGEPAEAE